MNNLKRCLSVLQHRETPAQQEPCAKLRKEGAEIDIQYKQLFSDRLRECAGEITTARTGRQIRETLSEAFILLSDAIREDEIPVQKLMMRCYLKGFFVGAVIIQAIIILFSQILGC